MKHALLSPTSSVSSLFFRKTSIFVAYLDLTVSVSESDIDSLSLAVAVIYTVPGATAVITPSASTVATFVSLLRHVTLLLEAFDGRTSTVAVRVSFG